MVGNKFKRFLVGEWSFNDSGLNVLRFVVVYLVFIGVLIGGIGMGLTSAVSNVYGEYLILSLGFGLFGLSMTSFIPLVLVKC